MARRRDAWATAVAWVRQHGGHVDGVGFDDETSGVRAQSDLAEGALVLRVPLHLCVTSREARASPVGSQALAAATASSELSSSIHDLVLAFHLAADTESGSPFHAPYYATLPQPGAADDPRAMMPRCWPDAEVETLLRGSPAADEARRSCANVRSDYELITKQPGAWPSFERFDWALAMVSSRCFTLQTESGDLDALVPLADMLNHARPRETAYRVVEQEAGGGSRAEGASFEMRMLRPMARGRAVHDTYGAKGNAQLLATYGFTKLVNFEPDGSSNDVLPLPLPAAGEDEAEYRGRRGSSLVYQAPTVAPLVIGPTSYAFSPLTKALDASRAHVLDAWEREQRAAGAGSSAKRLQGVGLEVKALKALSNRLAHTVGAYALGGYALNDDSAIAALSGCPPPLPEESITARGWRQPTDDLWRQRAAAAGALILSERTTLRFYARIVGLCLGVLSPSGLAKESAKDGRRAAAAQLRDEVEAARVEAARDRGSFPSTSLGTGPPRTVSEGVLALRLHARRDLAASVALAYVRVRWPALLQAESERKRKRRSA